VIVEQVSAQVLWVIEINPQHFDVLGRPMGLVVENVKDKSLFGNKGSITVRGKDVRVKGLDLTRPDEGINWVTFELTRAWILHNEMVRLVQVEVRELMLNLEQSLEVLLLLSLMLDLLLHQLGGAVRGVHRL
jgi:hypothetical protein